MKTAVRVIEWAWMVIVVLSLIEVIRLWNEGGQKLYIFIGFAAVGIIMFYFRRKQRRRMEKRMEENRRQQEEDQ